ncbi:MAG: hypothetical protein M1826_005140 [Phylliscum demangeonii]|nr:MAG: hypothetical protein M1826_005140 [Phylliscum demangeonii]
MERIRGRGRGTSCGRGRARDKSSGDSRPESSDSCSHCKKTGHSELDCREKYGRSKGAASLKATLETPVTNLNAVLASRLETAPKHICAKVAVRTPCGWTTVNALIDSGATMNFISHMTTAAIGIRPKASETPPRVATIEGNPL